MTLSFYCESNANDWPARKWPALFVNKMSCYPDTINVCRIKSYVIRNQSYVTSMLPPSWSMAPKTVSKLDSPVGADGASVT